MSAGPERRRRLRRIRWVGAAALALVLFGTGTAVVLARVSAEPAAAAPAGPAAPATAEVVRTDLAEQDTEDGTLGYGTERALNGQRGGTITGLPAAGAVLQRGQELYTVDAKPVQLWYGTMPLYRQLALGMTDGEDVRVLEDNLRALGYTGFGTPDTKFTQATANALKRWQRAAGLDQTGSLAPDAVVVRTGAVRVASVTAQVGDQAGGELLKLTGTDRVVTVKLGVSKQNLARQGDRVELAVTGGGRTRGVVASAGTTATPGEQGEEATVDVLVTLDDQSVAGRLTSAPVDVTFTTGTRTGVLAVPVGALLALAEGGMAVEVVTGNGSQLVGVRTGLFSGGLVEVTGNLRPGQRVVTTS
ncbi:peptidoglycan-binding protein [Amycolatopsis acidicola]|uniref:Peptidoglycan-binding protein n=1 Tax=Amycolatopsis acidicola TaxID=2596893 RepID=A0A5N0URG1_9PSEU|nr:peptidoglycan-binding domain-containing protein [Amycolatopsis acidicola]KAA9153807.1 peptidoglycan-binding protein [Amycolatopsis acidicola]